MVVRLGTATSSIIATGAIFLGISSVSYSYATPDHHEGQLLLLIGDIHSEVRVMTLGYLPLTKPDLLNLTNSSQDVHIRLRHKSISRQAF